MITYICRRFLMMPFNCLCTVLSRGCEAYVVCGGTQSISVSYSRQEFKAFGEQWDMCPSNISRYLSEVLCAWNPATNTEAQRHYCNWNVIRIVHRAGKSCVKDSRTFPLLKWLLVECIHQLSLCLTKHHTMKKYWGSGGIASHVLDLGTRWRWVVSFTPRPLYPVSIVWEAEWAPEPFCTRWWREKFPAPAGNRTLELRLSNP
jgi:hypothetical protein